MHGTGTILLSVILSSGFCCFAGTFMFFEPAPTPWDLKWRMLGTSVRVHPFFWLVTAVLGWSAYADPKAGGSLRDLGLWIACVFVSILLHEFGHIWMGRLFGRRGHIVLYSFGGLAIGSSDLPSRWQRIAVSLAGPGIQFALYGVLWAAGPHDRAGERGLLLSGWYGTAYLQLLRINWYWPLLNLLPIWPLDGGRVSRDLLEWISPRRGFSVALWLSVLIAAGLAVYFFHEVQYYTAFMFAWLAFGSFQAAQQLRIGDREDTWQQRAPWEQDPDAWKR
jgi:stage IV sporulation protein FB